jgi:hypothetical protein
MEDKKIEEDINEFEEIEENRRSHLTIQSFMNDMRILDDQFRDKNLVKPVFDYGSKEVTNYLLWLVLGELMLLNDKLEDED